MNTQTTIDFIPEILNVGFEQCASRISNLIGHVVTLKPIDVQQIEQTKLSEYFKNVIVVNNILSNQQTIQLMAFKDADVGLLLGSLLGEHDQHVIDDFSISAFQEIMQPASNSLYLAITEFTGKAIRLEHTTTVQMNNINQFEQQLSNQLMIAKIELVMGEYSSTMDFVFDENFVEIFHQESAHIEPIIETPQIDEVAVKEIVVPTFTTQKPIHNQADKKQNLDLIMNVPLHVSIELGKTKRKIKDIMDFSQGYVLELEKQTGAPVDIVVNGQLIARGDVVVIDENFAVRVTEIVNVAGLVINES